jgi:hypothetical protein
VKGDEGPDLLDRMIACEECYFSLTCWRNGQEQAKTPNDFLQHPPKNKPFFMLRSTLPTYTKRIKITLSVPIYIAESHAKTQKHSSLFQIAGKR